MPVVSSLEGVNILFGNGDVPEIHLSSLAAPKQLPRLRGYSAHYRRATFLQSQASGQVAAWVSRGALSAAVRLEGLEGFSYIDVQGG